MHHIARTIYHPAHFFADRINQTQNAPLPQMSPKHTVIRIKRNKNPDTRQPFPDRPQ
jgi:hypothetical protein